MDRRAFKNFITKRSSIWTLSLCMTGMIVLGGIAAVDRSIRTDEEQTESELGASAYLEKEADEHAEDINDTLLTPMEEADGAAQALGGVNSENSMDQSVAGLTDEDLAEGMAANSSVTDGISAGEDSAGTSDGTVSDGEAAQASSSNVISEQVLLQEGVSFTDAQSLTWPSAGTILIDYSMDRSIYFPTLNQYRYNPALVIASEAGNQVLASVKGIVESIAVDEVTGTTLVLNIGNGYRLTYGQLKELAVTEGDVVEEGALIGYVSEPTKYYSEEGSNLYFQMTQNGAPVDPVLYLE